MMSLMVTNFVLSVTPGVWVACGIELCQFPRVCLLILTVYSSCLSALFSDNASKLNLWKIVAIVVTGIGLVFMVAVALVIRTFMKMKTRRGSRKIHVRKMPQDDNMVKCSIFVGSTYVSRSKITFINSQFYFFAR